MLKCRKASLMVINKQNLLIQLNNDVTLCGDFEKIIQKKIDKQDCLSLINCKLTITIDCATNQCKNQCKNLVSNNNVLVKGVFEIMVVKYNATFPYLSVEKVSFLDNDKVVILCSITNFNLSEPTIKPQQEKEE